MKKFLVQYKCPLTVLDGWIAKPEEERKAEEQKMMEEWNKWTEANKSSIVEAFGVGKTKSIGADGVKDFRNEIMLAGIVQGESIEEITKIFEGHPHLQIPGAWIEVSNINSMK